MKKRIVDIEPGAVYIRQMPRLAGTPGETQEVFYLKLQRQRVINLSTFALLESFPQQLEVDVYEGELRFLPSDKLEMPKG